ncbi:MAG: hypothetical protein LBP62_01530 [Clostridiales bacterium]|jgi:hypothetical protein|nr:hypothetical protein [Clostridiales bacterium]
MKKIILLAIAVILCLSFAGCSMENGADEVKKEIDGIAEAFKSQTDYTAKETFYSERLTNFDYEKGLMPADKTPAEDKIWDKKESDGDGGVRLRTLISEEIDLDAVYESNIRRWFGEKVVTFTLLKVKALDGDDYAPFRRSAAASGEGEDFAVDWERADSLLIVTVSYTVKKNRLVKAEFLTETVSSYQKTTTQIWDGKTVTNRYGGRTYAEKIIIDIEY